MTVLGLFVVVFVLLVLVQQLNEKMYPLLFIVVLTLMTLYFWTTVWRPFIERLVQLFSAVPYSRQLLLTLSLLLLGDMLNKLMSQFDMESFGLLVLIATRISILAIWLEPIEELFSRFRDMSSLFGP